MKRRRPRRFRRTIKTSHINYEHWEWKKIDGEFFLMCELNGAPYAMTVAEYMSRLGGEA